MLKSFFILLIQVSQKLCYISCCSTCFDDSLGTVDTVVLRQHIFQNMTDLFLTFGKEVPINKNPEKRHWIQQKLLTSSYGQDVTIRNTITTKLGLTC